VKMYCKYIYIILSLLLLFIVFRLAGLGTHFVLSSRLEELEEHMTKEQDLSLDKIDTIIQVFCYWITQATGLYLEQGDKIHHWQVKKKSFFFGKK
jgi:hypothetical protein